MEGSVKMSKRNGEEEFEESNETTEELPIDVIAYSLNEFETMPTGRNSSAWNTDKIASDYKQYKEKGMECVGMEYSDFMAKYHNGTEMKGGNANSYYSKKKLAESLAIDDEKAKIVIKCRNTGKKNENGNVYQTGKIIVNLLAIEFGE